MQNVMKIGSEFHSLFLMNLNLNMTIRIYLGGGGPGAVTKAACLEIGDRGFKLHSGL